VLQIYIFVFELPAMILVTCGEHSNKFTKSFAEVIFFISPLSMIVSFKNLWDVSDKGDLKC
jgi:hypothetical protein